MNRMIAVLVLATSAFGQAGSGLRVTTSNGIVTFTNVGAQPIMAIVAEAQRNDEPIVTPIHEYFFKPSLMAVGEKWDFDMVAQEDRARWGGKLPPTKLTGRATYVQFADGSGWGDASSEAAKQLFSRRATGLDAYTRLDAAYLSGGEAGFLAELEKPQSGWADSLYRTVQSEVHDVGAVPAAAHVHQRLLSANARQRDRF